LKRYNFRKPRREVGTSEQVGPISICDSEEEKQFATTSSSTITTKRAYPRVDSRENPHSKQEAQQEKKSTGNGCKSMREEGTYSPG